MSSDEADGLLLSCSTVMKAAGVSRNALLNYERHSVVAPRRDENGYRTYTRGDLLDVMSCTMLLSMGYTVSEAAELLRGTDLLDEGNVEAHLRRLALQRDVAQAKMDNLAALQAATREATEPQKARFTLAECPDWLFFYDEHESGRFADAARDNQLALMRSVPLACRGFTISDFFSESPTIRWGRTLRRAHEHLLRHVEEERACVLGGSCLRTVVRAAYPQLDPDGILRARLQEQLDELGLRVVGDPFVPLLFNNRTPSPIFELFVPVEASG